MEGARAETRGAGQDQEEREGRDEACQGEGERRPAERDAGQAGSVAVGWTALTFSLADRKSTRLNSSHQIISYAVFCLKKKKKPKTENRITHTESRSEKR